MDQGGYGWGDDGATDHNTVTNEIDGDSAEGHHYYCPVNVGGACSCPVDEQTNNNDYSQFRKFSNDKRKTYGESLGLYEEESQYNSPYDTSYSDHSTDDHSVSDSPTYHNTSYAGSEDQSSSYTCMYCHGQLERNGPSGRCRHCNAHQNGAYCDYFDSSKIYGSPSGSSGEGSIGHPKIQVTAKILFGTVSAISDLKQKKAAKKN